VETAISAAQPTATTRQRRHYHFSAFLFIFTSYVIIAGSRGRQNPTAPIPRLYRGHDRIPVYVLAGTAGSLNLRGESSLVGVVKKKKPARESTAEKCALKLRCDDNDDDDGYPQKKKTAAAFLYVFEDTAR